MQISLRPSRRPAWLLLGVIGVFAAAEIAARLVLTTAPDAIRWYDASAQLKIEQMDDLDEVDVVFAGTSMAWQAFVPDSFDPIAGTTSYNAGLNGGTPEVMERWLLEEVVPRLHPTTVVWGLSSLDLAPNYGPQQREVYDDALETKTGILAEVEQAAARWSAFVANRSVLRSLNDLWGNGADLRETDFAEAADRLGADGERLEFRVNRGDRQRQIIQARLRDFDPHSRDIETITAVVAELERRGIEVVLVQLPVPLRFVEAHPYSTDDYRRVGITLDAIATANGLRFLDMTEGTGGSDFVDFTHLDEVAAREFSARLAEAITSGRDDRGASEFSTPGDNGTTADQGECVREVVTDDYGFEVEISNCPESDAAPDEAEPVATAQDVELADALEERDRLCRAGEDPTPGLLAVAEAIDGLGERIAGAESIEIGLTYPLVQDAALSSDDCTVPMTGIDVTAGTAAVSSALDRLYSLLDLPPWRASAVWGHRDRLAVALWLRDAQRKNVEIDGLVIGNSVARSALDPLALSERTGTTVGQASIGGMSIETAGPWLEEVLAVVEPTTIYWALSYYDLYSSCRVDIRASGAEELHDLRTTAFEGLVDDAARARWDHFLGPLDQDAYGTSTILESLNVDVVVPGRGLDGGDWIEPRPDLLEKQRSEVGTVWLPGEPCQDRASYLAEQVDELRASGHVVILVIIPPNPAFADDHPGGIPGYFDDAASLADGADPDHYIELDLRLRPEVFFDGIHLLADGRAELTEALGAALDDVPLDTAALTPPG